MFDKQFIYSSIQDVYTAAVEGIASQQWLRATDQETTQCRYRELNGANVRKCAIGWCIPDDVYTLELEGRSASDLMHFSNVYDAGVFDVDIIRTDDLDALQQAHDVGYTEHSMIKNLYSFGNVRGLDIPQVLKDAHAALSEYV